MNEALAEEECCNFCGSLVPVNRSDEEKDKECKNCLNKTKDKSADWKEHHFSCECSYCIENDNNMKKANRWRNV